MQVEIKNYDILEDKYEICSNLTNNTFIKKFKEQLEKRCPYFAEIITKALEGSAESLEVTQNSQVIFYPNNELLKQKARHYQEKYGITIHVVNEEDFLPMLAEMGKNRSSRFEGVIFDGEGGHVVPMLVYHSSEGQLAVVLDVLGLAGNYIEPVTKKFFHQLNQTQIQYIQCRTARQADKLSCRVGALVTLRNALLHLKEKNFDTKTSLISFLNVNNDNFDMPAEWGFTDQIFIPKDEWENILNPRQQYSKKQDKVIETLFESRQKYNCPLTFSCRFTVDCGQGVPKYNDLNQIELRAEGLPFKMTPQGKNLLMEQLVFSWQTTQVVNFYMLNKGQKLTR